MGHIGSQATCLLKSLLILGVTFALSSCGDDSSPQGASGHAEETTAPESVINDQLLFEGLIEEVEASFAGHYTAYWDTEFESGVVGITEGSDESGIRKIVENYDLDVRVVSTPFSSRTIAEVVRRISDDPMIAGLDTYVEADATHAIVRTSPTDADAVRSRLEELELISATQILSTTSVPRPTTGP